MGIKRLLKTITIFLGVLFIGILLGYIVQENKEGIEEFYQKTKNIIRGKLGKTLVVDEGIVTDKVTVVDEGYEEGKYVIYTDEKIADINYVITYRMRAYYKLAVSALDREKRREQGVDTVRVQIGDGEDRIGFDISHQRREDLEWSIGEEFYLTHIREKGWDVLNNVDTFWMTAKLRNGIEPWVEERIEWKKYKDT